MNAGRLFISIVWMLCASGAALSQTVAETAKRPDVEQRALIAGFVDNSLKNLGSHTDQSGKPKSAEQYEQDRALANFARAFLTQDTTSPNEVPPGFSAVLTLIKRDAVSSPDKSVADVMGGLVDGAFAHFYTTFYTDDKKADFAKKTDADQVGLFRLNIALYQNDRLYKRVMKGYEDEKRAIDADLKEMYDNSVILADGRHALISNNGDFMVVPADPNDNSEVKLEGASKDEAQRLYDCMKARGIKNGLKGREACAQPAGPVDASKGWTAENESALLEGVREDVAEYLEASKTGFDAYKSGKESQGAAGSRAWESSVKPILARGCWVVQGTNAATFSCALTAVADLEKMQVYFGKLTAVVTASLPGDWSADEAPPFGPEFPASKGYRSSSGAHAEVWLANAESGGGYEMHFELVSAPLGAAVNPPPEKPAEDDPIGEGGFIKPNQ